MTMSVVNGLTNMVLLFWESPGIEAYLRIRCKKCVPSIKHTYTNLNEDNDNSIINQLLLVLSFLLIKSKDSHLLYIISRSSYCESSRYYTDFVQPIKQGPFVSHNYWGGYEYFLVNNTVN